jgi:uncharacterized protein YjbI with pentapeptide repeats
MMAEIIWKFGMKASFLSLITAFFGGFVMVNEAKADTPISCVQMKSLVHNKAIQELQIEAYEAMPNLCDYSKFGYKSISTWVQKAKLGSYMDVYDPLSEEIENYWFFYNLASCYGPQGTCANPSPKPIPRVAYCPLLPKSTWRTGHNWVICNGKRISGVKFQVSGERFQFRHSVILNTNFENISLKLANFSSTNLTKSNFSYSDLTGANLTGANLTGALISKANLSSITFRGASTGVKRSSEPPANMPAGLSYISGCLIGKDVIVSSCRISSINDIDLENLDFSKTTFINVKSSNLTGFPKLPRGYRLANGYIVGPSANLTNADLSGSNLSGLDLSNAKLIGVKSGSIKGRPKLPHSWQLHNGYLFGKDADLSHSEITSVDLGNIDISSATLAGAKWRRISGSPELPINYSIRSGYLIGPSANLSGANLSGMTFRKVSLQHSDMREANLNQVRFEEVDLSESNLTSTDLSRSIFEKVNLSKSNLSGSNLNQASFTDVNINRTNLRTTNLISLRATRVTGNPSLPDKWQKRAGFLIGESADLSNQDFGSIDLSLTNLAGVNLSNSDLTRANLDYVKSSGVIGIPLLPKSWQIIEGHLVGPKADLEFIDFGGQELRHVNITGAKVNGTNFTGADLTGVNSGELVGTPILDENWRFIDNFLVGPGANLSGADLSNANLDGLDLRTSDLTRVKSGKITGNFYMDTQWRLVDGYILGPSVNLENATLADISISNLDLTNAIFTNASISGITGSGYKLSSNYEIRYGMVVGPSINFRNLNLAGMQLQNLDLSGANFSNSNLSSTVFQDSNLSYVDFNSANLEGTVFKGANLTGAKSGNNIGSYQIKVTFNEFLPNPYVLTLVSDGQPIGNGYFVSCGYLLGPNLNLRGANLQGCKLESFYDPSGDHGIGTVFGSDFSGANVSFSEFKDFNIQRTCFNGATITNSKFERVSIGTASADRPTFTNAIGTGMISTTKGFTVLDPETW